MKTTWQQKLLASVVNLLIVFIVAIPIQLIGLDTRIEKLIIVLLFFVSEVAFLSFGTGRDIGMRVIGSYWRQHYSLGRKLIYCGLYSLSFSTIFLWIRYPLDVLLLNLLLIQLPSILLTGTTFHGWLAGMLSVTGKGESA